MCVTPNFTMTEQLCDCCKAGKHELCNECSCHGGCGYQDCACRISEHALDNRGANPTLIARWEQMLADTKERTDATARVRQ